MLKMTQQQANEKIRLHVKYLRGEDGGKRADFSRMDLSHVNLAGAYLYRANLAGAYLSNTNLDGADLSHADLSNANLSHADLSDANLSHAYLYRANLSHAYLYRANLSHAYLHHANLSITRLDNSDLTETDLTSTPGNMREVKSIQIDTYHITYTHDRLFIGCQGYSIEDWRNFTDEQIFKMDGRRALNFWRDWKDTIFNIIDKSPAVPTS